ncbi:hypothetical protein GN958_ATG00536 [Phytophthora infestans]|uniref:Uncharacterized protein n=1 Tax=Phytophthora infestans TaxID=4787 RepID=A0A8S9V7W7_PHYIN|nr:hypothetical protein GN958_ATG01834 [Phytophthora infestans]KAF4150328.1 hypothetical protein GN958_ATG00536 [Phytophthora infestans]
MTTHRSGLSSHNIEMCSFLSRNSQFTHVTQFETLPGEEYEKAIPTSMLVDLEPRINDQPTLTEWEVSMSSVWDDIGDEENKDD